MYCMKCKTVLLPDARFCVACGIPVEDMVTATRGVATGSTVGEPAVDEDAIYAAIAKELETGNTDKGLWTRLFAECDGDENRTKVAYIKRRATTLRASEQSRLDNLSREHAAEASRALSAKLLDEEFWRKLKSETANFNELRRLVGQHVANPRLTIDEKAQLLRYAGGSFRWTDGHRCTAIFRGQEKHFSSGNEFAAWYVTEVVPFLDSIVNDKGTINAKDLVSRVTHEFIAQEQRPTHCGVDAVPCGSCKRMASIQERYCPYCGYNLSAGPIHAHP